MEFRDIRGLTEAIRSEVGKAVVTLMGAPKHRNRTERKSVGRGGWVPHAER